MRRQWGTGSFVCICSAWPLYVIKKLPNFRLYLLLWKIQAHIEKHQNINFDKKIVSLFIMFYHWTICRRVCIDSWFCLSSRQKFVGRHRFCRQGMFARITTDGLWKATSCIALSEWDTGLYKKYHANPHNIFDWCLDKPTMLAYRIIFLPTTPLGAMSFLGQYQNLNSEIL